MWSLLFHIGQKQEVLPNFFDPVIQLKRLKRASSIFISTCKLYTHMLVSIYGKYQSFLLLLLLVIVKLNIFLHL